MKKSTKYITFLLTVFVVYFNNETLSNNLCQFVNQPCLYVVISELFLFFLYGDFQKIHVEKNSLICAGILVFSLLFSGTFDSTFSNGYLLAIMNIMLAITMVRLMSFKTFSFFYITIMTFLGVSSLVITYIPYNILNLLPFNHVENSSFIPFTNAILSYRVDFPDYYRNTGIFREAGVWGAFLVVAVILLFKIKEFFSHKQFTILFVVLTITLISTFSSACFLALAFVLLIELLYGNNDKKMKLWFGLLMTISVISFISISETSDALNESLEKFSANSSSYQARTDIYKNVIPIFLSNPFGHGILNGTRLFMNSSTVDTFHNTSTIATSVIYFGIFFFVAYFFGIWQFSKKCLKIGWYIIPIMILLNAEQYIFNPIWYMFIFYGYSYRQNNSCLLSIEANIKTR